MKKLAILFIAATMALAAADAQAIDFKAKGIWQVGMGLSQRNFVKSVGGNKTDSNDVMNSRSRIRFQMVACAFVEICWPTMWCTTAEKRSVSTSLSMCPACAMTAAIRSSLALRYAVSASPYWKYICPAFFLYNLSFVRQLLI